MAANHLSDFDLDWCQQLIRDPSLTEINPPSAEKPLDSEGRPITSHGHDFKSFLTKTLATDETIRACRAFCRRKKLASGEETAEVCMMFSLGSGMNGHIGTAHGGVATVLLDEVMGTAGMVTAESNFLVKAQNIMTGEMTVRFVKPMRTPCVVLCRSWVERREGRKIYVKASLEDGRGGVLVQSHGLFIVLKEQPKNVAKIQDSPKL